LRKEENKETLAKFEEKGRVKVLLMCEGLSPTEEEEAGHRHKVSPGSGNEANREREREKEHDKSPDHYKHLELLFCKVHFSQWGRFIIEHDLTHFD